jgi:hypothetical protein
MVLEIVRKGDLETANHFVEVDVLGVRDYGTGVRPGIAGIWSPSPPGLALCPSQERSRAFLRRLSKRGCERRDSNRGSTPT